MTKFYLLWTFDADQFYGLHGIRRTNPTTGLIKNTTMNSLKIPGFLI